MQTVKKILESVLDAFCFDSRNRDKAIKIAGLDSSEIYNGKNDYYAIRKIILDSINEETAKDIINKIPFPFIEGYSPIEEKTQKLIELLVGLDSFKRDFFYWTDEILCPLTKKGGMINSEGYEIVVN